MDALNTLNWLDETVLDPKRAAEARSWLADRQRRYIVTGSPVEQGVMEWNLLSELLAAELLQQRWTLDEAGRLAELHMGVIPTLAISAAGRPSMLWEDLSEGIAAEGEDHLSQMEVGTSGFLERIAALGPTAEHALVDALSRWWSHRHDHSVEGWAQVGIQIVEPTHD